MSPAAPPAKVAVTLRGPGGPWTGALGRSPAIGVLRLRFPPGPSPSLLPLGSVLEAELVGARASAELVGVELLGEDTEVELRCPLAPAPLDGAPDGSERRVWLRVAPRVEAVPVPIRLSDGVPSARNLVGILCDASPRGLGLRFDLAAEARLCATSGLDCTFELVRGEGVRDWRCAVANRRLVRDPVTGRDAVRYGLRFHLAPDEWLPAFELQWDCSCGQFRLLARTHAWCPGCGAARPEGPHRRPDWEDLVTALTHRFTGTIPCRSCSTAHSPEARYCGNCGADLPGPRP